MWNIIEPLVAAVADGNLNLTFTFFDCRIQVLSLLVYRMRALLILRNM